MIEKHIGSSTLVYLAKLTVLAASQAGAGHARWHHRRLGAAAGGGHRTTLGRPVHTQATQRSPWVCGEVVPRLLCGWPWMVVTKRWWDYNALGWVALKLPWTASWSTLSPTTPSRHLIVVGLGNFFLTSPFKVKLVWLFFWVLWLCEVLLRCSARDFLAQIEVGKTCINIRYLVSRFDTYPLNRDIFFYLYYWLWMSMRAVRSV